jgi:hypothetical protein
VATTVLLQLLLVGKPAFTRDLLDPHGAAFDA